MNSKFSPHQLARQAQCHDSRLYPFANSVLYLAILNSVQVRLEYSSVSIFPKSSSWGFKMWLSGRALAQQERERDQSPATAPSPTQNEFYPDRLLQTAILSTIPKIPTIQIETRGSWVPSKLEIHNENLFLKHQTSAEFQLTMGNKSTHYENPT